jgi:hypothetical protein
MKYTCVKYFTLFNAMFILFISSCKKQDNFLDAKPDQALVIGSSLTDYQLLLNNETIFNSISDPGFGMVTADDDYYILDATWDGGTAPERNGYIWAQNFYESDPFYNDWSKPYTQVYYCNTVLEGLSKLQVSAQDLSQSNQIKGSALFYRAYAFYNLVQTFAMPYDSATANTDPGICLRLTADFNIPSTRATVQQCYNQILEDLQIALDLLPATATYKTQPSKWATNALFARIYLAMRNYAKAFTYSQACLSQNSILTDYNTLSPSSTNISTTFLDEDIFHSTMVNWSINTRNNAIIDSTLYNSYSANDLRKMRFFFLTNNKPYFKGSYDYKSTKFSGLATDEIYLIRAECNARLGNTTAAMTDLNNLLRTRWLKISGTSTYVDQFAADPNDALMKILVERRKELIFRGLRWTDLRRFNKEPALKKTLTRIIKGVTYTLLPNDVKYAVPIPPTEIQLSGIPQNPR